MQRLTNATLARRALRSKASPVFSDSWTMNIPAGLSKYSNDSVSENGHVKSHLINELQTVGFSTDESEAILNKNSHLINEATYGLLPNYLANLETIMPKKDARMTFTKAPAVALKNFSEVQKVHEYVIETMRISNEELSHSKALSKSLSHIRTRHILLLRAGLHEQPAFDGQTKNRQNLTLHKIVDTTDTDFVKDTGLTLSEMNTFRKVLCLEDDIENEIQNDIDKEETPSYKKKPKLRRN